MFPERTGLDYQKKKKEKVQPGDGPVSEDSKGAKESASIFGLINKACSSVGESSQPLAKQSHGPILSKRQEGDLRQDLLKSGDQTRNLESNLDRLRQSLERNKRNPSLVKHILGEIEEVEKRLRFSEEHSLALKKAIHKKKEDRKPSKHLF